MSKYKFSLNPQVTETVETKYRNIKTEIPYQHTSELISRLERVESRSMHGQLPLVWDRAEDFSVYDKAGNRWIDFTSGIFVANVGHSNPRVLGAIKNTLAKPLISCYNYPTIERVSYLEKIVEFAGSPFEKAFLLSSGTEATEAVLKLMRMHGLKNGKRNRGIICVENNWHGRTLGAQMMSSNLSQREWIGYQDPFIHHIPFPYPWVLEGCTGEEFFNKSISKLEHNGINIENDICGIFLETFQGWASVFYPHDFIATVSDLCSKHGVLLAFDEIQSGFGRTGLNFGYQHYKVSPDLLACGKGMGGGVPLSGVIGKGEIMDYPEVGNMSSTHSANPLVCAAGMAVLEELEYRGLVNEAERKGKIFYGALKKIKDRFPEHVSWVFGNGMIYAMLFKNPNSGLPDQMFPSRVVELCMKKGVLLVHTGRESIKMGPPLTITEDALLEGIGVLEEAISEIIINYSGSVYSK